MVVASVKGDVDLRVNPLKLFEGRDTIRLEVCITPAPEWVPHAQPVDWRIPGRAGGLACHQRSGIEKGFVSPDSNNECLSLRTSRNLQTMHQ
jgi:hypothetical protein